MKVQNITTSDLSAKHIGCLLIVGDNTATIIRSVHVNKYAVVVNPSNHGVLDEANPRPASEERAYRSLNLVLDAPVKLIELP